MAGRERMQWGARAVVALAAVAFAVGAACGGGGGGGTTFQFLLVFPQGHLPLALPGAGGSGDVAIRSQGDLYAVTGTADVTVVSREDGSVDVFSSVAGAALQSIVVGADGRLFAGDTDGIVYAIDTEGMLDEMIDTGTGEPITGLAVAPPGFGDAPGAVIAAAGDAGLLRITTGETTEVVEIEPDTGPLRPYVDLVFSGTTLFALDASVGEVVTVDAAGTHTLFQGGFDTPVGLGIDPTSSELLVADAGEATLYAIPVAGGTPVPRAPYAFDPTPPSGIAYDGIGALAWMTAGTVLRGSSVPRIDPANPNFGSPIGAATSGYGDLELVRDGSFLFVENAFATADDSDDSTGGEPSVNNFLILLARDHSVANVLASRIGEAGDVLLSLAYDPATEVSWIGTREGTVYRRDADGAIAFFAEASAAGDAVLGLELAPPGFGAFGGHLVATTEMGEVLAIDLAAPEDPPDVIASIQTTSGQPAPLSDLVFALDGTLYVLDNGSSSTPGDPRVLIVSPGGGVTDLGANPGQLGQPDAIEIDEGGERLLVVVSDDPDDQLVEVSLADGSVAPLADLPLSADDGYFPGGVVYDRLGTAVVRQGDGFTALGAFSVFP